MKTVSISLQEIYFRKNMLFKANPIHAKETKGLRRSPIT